MVTGALVVGVARVEKGGHGTQRVGGVRPQAPHQVAELLGAPDGLQGIDDVVEVVAAGARPDHVAGREGKQDPISLDTRGGRLATSWPGSASTWNWTTTSG